MILTKKSVTMAAKTIQTNRSNPKIKKMVTAVRNRVHSSILQEPPEVAMVIVEAGAEAVQNQEVAQCFTNPKP